MICVFRLGPKPWFVRRFTVRKDHPRPKAARLSAIGPPRAFREGSIAAAFGYGDPYGIPIDLLTTGARLSVPRPFRDRRADSYHL